jgi:hypothetical protein
VTLDASSQRALGLFNKHSGTHFDTGTAGLDALSAVRAKTARVCPLTCKRGYRSDGDRCIHITCNHGFLLNSYGECEQRKEPRGRRRIANRLAMNPQRTPLLTLLPRHYYGSSAFPSSSR